MSEEILVPHECEGGCGTTVCGSRACADRLCKAADSAFPPSLAIALRQETDHNPSNVAHDVTDLEKRVEAMRRLGVTRWANIELGPLPAEAQDDDQVQEQRLTFEKRESARRERVRFAASGGPRLGDRTPR